MPPTTVPPKAAPHQAATGSLLAERSAAADTMGTLVYVLAAQIESGLEPTAITAHKEERVKDPDEEGLPKGKSVITYFTQVKRF